jgi:hypothetical protein
MHSFSLPANDDREIAWIKTALTQTCIFIPQIFMQFGENFFQIEILLNFMKSSFRYSLKALNFKIYLNPTFK